MYHYEHFSPQGERKSGLITEEEASAMIGRRVLTSFPVVQRFVRDPEGDHFFLTYFQSDVTGSVWAVYYEAA